VLVPGAEKAGGSPVDSGGESGGAAAGGLAGALASALAARKSKVSHSGEFFLGFSFPLFWVWGGVLVFGSDVLTVLCR